MCRWLGALAPVLCCLLLSLPAPAAAQFEFGPSIGLFWPIGGWTMEFRDTQTQIVDQEERRNIATGLIGARFAYWTSARLGLEATVGFAPSQVAVSNLDGTVDKSASVLMSSGRLLVRALTLTDGDRRDPTRWDFIVGVGAGVMFRRGEAWENTTGITHPAAVLMLETRAHFSGALTFRAGLEDFISSPTFYRGLPAESFPRVQHDILCTFALQIPLGGAAR